jgi:hypothetical protein
VPAAEGALDAEGFGAFESFELFKLFPELLDVPPKSEPLSAGAVAFVFEFAGA